MIAVQMVAQFLAGVFLCNGIPHVSAGLRGEAFPTPFAKPSSALVNFYWGTFNLAVGVLLLRLFSIIIGNKLGLALFAVGFVLMGTFLAVRFGKIR